MFHVLWPRKVCQNYALKIKSKVTIENMLKSRLESVSKSYIEKVSHVLKSYLEKVSRVLKNYLEKRVLKNVLKCHPKIHSSKKYENVSRKLC